uniref:Uncharacterized protein n=1 Tax=Rhipicephalus zambeziensis TaxID=60191 RepID=A0A224YH32_9ACAR
MPQRCLGVLKRPSPHADICITQASHFSLVLMTKQVSMRYKWCHLLPMFRLFCDIKASYVLSQGAEAKADHCICAIPQEEMSLTRRMTLLNAPKEPLQHR